MNPEEISTNMEATNPILPNTQPSLQSLMDTLLTLREEKRILTKQLDAITESYDTIKDQIFAILDSLGTRGASSLRATVSISESEIPVLEDKDSFWEYIRDSNSYELLDFRPGITATRELHQMGIDIPGVNFVTVRRLSLTALKAKKK